MFKKFNYFLKFLFFLGASGNIRKRCGLVSGFILIFCLGKIHYFSAAALLAHHKEPENSHCSDEKKGRKHGNPPGGFFYGKIIRLHFCCGKAVLFIDYVDVGKEYGNVRNKIFDGFALILTLFRLFYNGKITGSKVEGIAFNFGIFKHRKNFVILRYFRFFLVHSEHKGGKEQKQNKRNDV